MKTRLKKRRERIGKRIVFYLQTVMNGEWVSNKEICLHLELGDVRVLGSSNDSITSSALGQYMRLVKAEKREIYIGNERNRQYRFVEPGEEE